MPELSGFATRRAALVAQQDVLPGRLRRISGVGPLLLLTGAAFLIDDGLRTLSVGIQPQGYAGAGASATWGGLMRAIIGGALLLVVVLRSRGQLEPAMSALVLDRRRSVRELGTSPAPAMLPSPPWDARDLPPPERRAVMQHAFARDASLQAGSYVLLGLAAFAVFLVAFNLLLIPSRTLTTTVACLLGVVALETVVAWVAVDLARPWIAARSALRRALFERLGLVLLRRLHESGDRIAPTFDLRGLYWCAAAMVSGVVLVAAATIGSPLLPIAAFGLLALHHVWSADVMRRSWVAGGFYPDPGTAPLVTDVTDPVTYAVDHDGVLIESVSGDAVPVRRAWDDLVGIGLVRLVPGAPDAVVLLHESDSLTLHGEGVAGRVLTAYAAHLGAAVG